LAAIVVVALAARMVTIIALSDIDPMRGDGRRYFKEAGNILAGRSYGWNRSPGYCTILAGAQLICGGQESIKVVQGANVVLGVLAVVGVYALGVLTHGRRLGEVAAAIIALDPRYITHAIFSIIENGYVPLCVWSLAAVIWGMKKPGAARGLLAGVVIGLATLVRSFMMYFIFVAAAATLIWGTGRRWSRFLQAAMIVVVAALMIMPWTIRNWYEYNRFVPVSFEDGHQFVRGNVYHQPDYDKYTKELMEIARTQVAPTDPRRALKVDLNSALRRKGVELIIERQPLWAFQKIAKYGPALLEPGGYILARGAHDPEILGETGVVVVFWFFTGTQTVILLLSVIGLARHTRSPGDILLILYVLYSFAIHLTTHMSIFRYQLPYNWFFILFAARAFVDRPLLSRKRITAAVVLMALAVSSLVVNAIRAPDAERKEQLEQKRDSLPARVEASEQKKQERIDRSRQRRDKRAKSEVGGEADDEDLDDSDE